jgi:hypothetical protein
MNPFEQDMGKYLDNRVICLSLSRLQKLFLVSLLVQVGLLLVTLAVILLYECEPTYVNVSQNTGKWSPSHILVGIFQTENTRKNLRRFNQEVMREHSRNGPSGKYDGKERLSIFWFLEFQDRGAPHYHMFGTWFPSKEWVSKTWYRIVDSEDIRHLHAGTRTEFLRTGRGGTISYASKYANKLKQKVPPKDFENVGRFWGICGNRKVVSASTFVGSDLASFNRTYEAIKSMFYELNKLIDDGNAKVSLRKEGVLVVTILNSHAENRMINQVARLTAVSGVQRDLFFDAELDDVSEKLQDQDRFNAETRFIGDYPFYDVPGDLEKSNQMELKPCL